MTHVCPACGKLEGNDGTVLDAHIIQMNVMKHKLKVATEALRWIEIESRDRVSNRCDVINERARNTLREMEAGDA